MHDEKVSTYAGRNCFFSKFCLVYTGVRVAEPEGISKSQLANLPLHVRVTNGNAMHCIADSLSLWISCPGPSRGWGRGVIYPGPRDVWGPRRRSEIQNTSQCTILKRNSIFLPRGARKNVWWVLRECFPGPRCGCRRACSCPFSIHCQSEI